jgi:SAM-dependent methyltransferase
MSSERPAPRLLELLLRAGTSEHYEDPALYDYEYRRRRRDVNWYRALAREVGGGTSTSVLELGCGTGRLLVPLLRDGHQVLGVDRARPMLARCVARVARLPASRRGKGRLLQADFRALPLSPQVRFPLIVCPFNAFMHLYTRQDIEACLQEVRAHLQPGGLFALDVLMPDLTFLNRDPGRRWARTRFRHPETGERLIYSTSTTYDPVGQITITRIFYDPDEQEGGVSGGAAAQGQVVHLAHRQFFPAELEALLHYNGLRIERRDGGFDGEPLTPASAEQVIRARLR